MYVCMTIHHVTATSGHQKRAQDPQEVEFQILRMNLGSLKDQPGISAASDVGFTVFRPHSANPLGFTLRAFSILDQ